MSESARLMTLQEKLESHFRESMEWVIQNEVDRMIERVKWEAQKTATSVIADVLMESFDKVDGNDFEFVVRLDKKALIK